MILYETEGVVTGLEYDPGRLSGDRRVTITTTSGTTLEMDVQRGVTLPALGAAVTITVEFDG